MTGKELAAGALSCGCDLVENAKLNAKDSGAEREKTQTIQRPARLSICFLPWCHSGCNTGLST
jgi:hypothetical protein